MQTRPFERRNRQLLGKGVVCVPKLAFLVAYLTAQRKSQDQTIFDQSDFETIICEIRRARAPK
jgi:hypothetical protein